MITNKMRKTLVEELGYLNNEVNEMDPQIAAVLLEKRLPRPMNGMPASWKRPAGSYRNFLSFQPLTSLFSRVANFLKGVTSSISSGIPEVLPFALPVAAVAILVSFVPQTLPALVAGLSQQTQVFKRKAKAAKNVANDAVNDVSKKVSKKYRRRLQVMVTSDLQPAGFKTFLKKPSVLAKAKAQASDVNIRNFERVAERKLSDVFSIVKNSLFRQYLFYMYVCIL